jgi:hypothetical protein
MEFFLFLVIETIRHSSGIKKQRVLSVSYFGETIKLSLTVFAKNVIKRHMPERPLEVECTWIGVFGGPLISRSGRDPGALSSKV